jgi:hypothetical protein
MIQVIRFRKPDVDKRKRIPLDPTLQHTNKIVSSRSADQAQPQNDDQAGDIIHHFRIIIRFEGQPDIPYVGTV